MPAVEDADLHLALWAVRAWDGEPRNLQPHEHDELRRVTAADLPRLHLAHPAWADVVRRPAARPAPDRRRPEPGHPRD
ncbi:hypothetical protein [Geodermatophilus sp. SYSU D00766]